MMEVPIIVAAFICSFTLIFAPCVHACMENDPGRRTDIQSVIVVDGGSLFPKVYINVSDIVLLLFIVVVIVVVCCYRCLLLLLSMLLLLRMLLLLLLLLLQ